MDAEGLVLDPVDHGFWVSDEYGPYVYKFTSTGHMVQAIRPPDAILPHRNDTVSFSAASATVYDPDHLPVPEDPETGRNNNQGLEALSLSTDGKTLYTMMQSALNQEGGPKKKNRQPTRLLAYDISADKPTLKHEYAVLLPKYHDYTKDDKDDPMRVASQSEILALPTGDFLILSRDSNFGHGQDNTRSVYRHVDVFSVSNSTTDLKGKYDEVGASIASSKGKLNEDVTPVEYCPFLDFNVDAELAKCGLHNGGEQDAGLLNEKWESLALVPAGSSPRGNGKKEYFLFTFSDNDFMTQDGKWAVPVDIMIDRCVMVKLMRIPDLGHMNFGQFQYSDESGYDIDNQVLVFRVEF